MFHILGFIFFIIIFVLLIGLVLVYKIVKSVLNVGKKTARQNNEDYNTGQGGGYTRTRKETSKSKKKVFDDNEGEYIEFEEIKDKSFISFLLPFYALFTDFNLSYMFFFV